MLAPEEGTGESAAEVRLRVGLKFGVTSGKYFPFCASPASFAARNVAKADCRSGLLRSARSTKALSAGDLNSTHHFCGISRPSTNRCGRPVGASVAEVCPESGSRV